MSKHKKPQSPYGSTPRGPGRWERAAANAFMRPNSAAAKLYLNRVTNAHRLRTEYSNTVGPFAHPKFEYSSYARGPQVSGVAYYTCSLYCCAMVVQLDNGKQTYDQLLDFMAEGGNLSVPRREKPTKTVRCQCCGTSITP